MSDLIRTVLIMSISGSIASVLLFALKPLIRNRLPKAAQYYLWLVVIVALLVPFSRFVKLPDNASAPIPVAPVYTVIDQVPMTWDEEIERPQMGEENQKFKTSRNQLLFFVYLYPLGAAGVLLYFIINYAVFTGWLRRRNIAANEEERVMLTKLCVNRRVPRLYRNPLAATPMLIGLFRPSVILPDNPYTGEQLNDVMLHELTHMRRWDILVMWLSVLACAVHWFNPVVWLVRREIDRACELSCDEAIIRELNMDGKQKYGDTLIYVAADAKTPYAVLSTTMCEEKKALKERLGAIMKSKKHTRIAAAVSLILLVAAASVVIALGAGRAADTPPDQISAPMIYTALEQAIKDAIITNNRGGYGGNGDFAASSFAPLKLVGDDTQVTVYGMAYYAEYTYNDGIQLTAGSHVPVAITFDDDTLEILEYWEAADGSYYTPSIREKFPEDIWDNVDTQLYIEQQKEDSLRQAREYYASNPPHQNDSEPLPVSDRSIAAARVLADHFVAALNDGRALTGDDNAMDSWRERFDLEKWQVTAGEVYETPNSENHYYFNVRGTAHYGDPPAAEEVLVYINMQGDELWFFCPYTYYRPLVEGVLESYFERIAEGDVRKLAVWLSVDGGQDPSEEFYEQAERVMAEYENFDLTATEIMSVTYFNDERYFWCTVRDAKGDKFPVELRYGDGLIMPVIVVVDRA